MATIKLTTGVGYFKLNESKFPKGQFVVEPFGTDEVQIKSTSGGISINLKWAELVDSVDTPYASQEAVLTALNSAFNLGGGDGFGVMTLAEYNAIADKGEILYFIKA